MRRLSIVLRVFTESQGNCSDDYVPLAVADFAHRREAGDFH